MRGEHGVREQSACLRAVGVLKAGGHGVLWLGVFLRGRSRISGRVGQAWAVQVVARRNKESGLELSLLFVLCLSGVRGAGGGGCSRQEKAAGPVCLDSPPSWLSG